MMQPLWKTVQRIFKKLKTDLPYDPAIPFPGKHQTKPQFKKINAVL